MTSLHLSGLQDLAGFLLGYSLQFTVNYNLI